jgi:apolipoprotein D and lipocalin family protein
MTNLRFIHAVQGAPSVDVYVDGHKTVQNLSYSEVTAYFPKFTRGSLINVNVVVAGTQDVVLSEEIRVNTFDENVTISVSGGLAFKTTFSSHVDNMEAENGYGRLNIVHLSADAPGIDFLVGKDVLARNVKYLSSKNNLLKLGEFFHLARVNISGGNVTVVGPLRISPGSRSSHTLFVIGITNIQGVLVRNNTELKEPLAENFSAEKYMGKWNLIAEIPQPYNRGGCANQVAIYTLLNDRIKVYNQCIDKNGIVVNDVTGKAIVPNVDYPAALKVSFPLGEEFGVESDDANYLVHMVDNSSDGYAIVGSPNRASYYLLAREKKVQKVVYCRFLSYGRKWGYQVDKVKLQYHTIR